MGEWSIGRDVRRKWSHHPCNTCKLGFNMNSERRDLKPRLTVISNQERSPTNLNNRVLARPSGKRDIVNSGFSWVVQTDQQRLQSQAIPRNDHTKGLLRVKMNRRNCATWYIYVKEHAEGQEVQFGTTLQRKLFMLVIKYACPEQNDYSVQNTAK